MISYVAQHALCAATASVEGDDVDALRASIRAWNTYKRHVATKSRRDLVKRADGQIKKLEAMR